MAHFGQIMTHQETKLLCCFGLNTENSTFSSQKKLKAQLVRGFTTNITTQDHIKINKDVWSWTFECWISQSLWSHKINCLNCFLAMVYPKISTNVINNIMTILTQFSYLPCWAMFMYKTIQWPIMYFLQYKSHAYLGWKL